MLSSVKFHSPIDNLTHLLFSYGTLQLETVQLDTFGRLLKGAKDILSGYIVSEIEVKDPEVIKSSGTATHSILQFTGKASDQVEGTVFKISDAELCRADAYEVEEYTRIEATLLSGRKAWIYVAS